MSKLFRYLGLKADRTIRFSRGNKSILTSSLRHHCYTECIQYTQTPFKNVLTHV